MKLLIPLSLLAIVFSLDFFPLHTRGTLIVSVENINTAKGNLRLGIYNSAQSYDAEDKPERWQVFPATQTGTIKVEIDDLPFGKYAIAMIHDVNENKKMDFNFVGIPKEPYGFSIKSAKLKKPSFADVQFDFQKNKQTVSVKLVAW